MLNMFVILHSCAAVISVFPFVNLLFCHLNCTQWTFIILTWHDACCNKAQMIHVINSTNPLWHGLMSWMLSHATPIACHTERNVFNLVCILKKPGLTMIWNKIKHENKVKSETLTRILLVFKNCLWCRSSCKTPDVVADILFICEMLHTLTPAEVFSTDTSCVLFCNDNLSLLKHSRPGKKRKKLLIVMSQKKS